MPWPNVFKSTRRLYHFQICGDNDDPKDYRRRYCLYMLEVFKIWNEFHSVLNWCWWQILATSYDGDKSKISVMLFSPKSNMSQLNWQSIQKVYQHAKSVTNMPRVSPTYWGVTDLKNVINIALAQLWFTKVFSYAFGSDMAVIEAVNQTPGLRLLNQ